MFLNNEISTDIQAKPRSLSRRFGCEKGVENFRNMFRSDSRTAVLYFDNDPWILPLCSDNNGASPPHGINRIINKVRPNLVQLTRVGFDHREVFGILANNLNALFQFAAQNNECVIQFLTKINRLHWSLVHVGVGLERFHQGDYPVGCQSYLSN